jgi:hypothetical protein
MYVLSNYLIEAKGGINCLLDNTSSTYVHVIQSIPVTVQSKALICDWSIAVTAGSSPAEGVDIYFVGSDLSD